jgi:hypothetical protein
MISGLERTTMFAGSLWFRFVSFVWFNNNRDREYGVIKGWLAGYAWCRRCELRHATHHSRPDKSTHVNMTSRTLLSGSVK